MSVTAYYTRRGLQAAVPVESILGLMLYLQASPGFLSSWRPLRCLQVS